jgi:hypothetical protein
MADGYLTRESSWTEEQCTDPEGVIRMTQTAAAEALFVSSVQPSDDPSPIEISRAVRRSLQLFGGAAGCASACAYEYGEHPEQAARRMQWARSLVSGATRAAAA